ncbi:lysophospholipid acyltransferase family protein [Robiginitalea sp. M366]|uniref:lysophospholipid acyltransferase family protein n=1 Tax=Robiginitalea aestuariiviva TaxID=3036903 RepID=UPI00240D6AF2|nr:lysophospholipid acyltransferase family protein [Robiginitalea aestuariiviva]MDG1571345.1 lysophospholipid acyltransferase family protein [Robiginitalea aestuariiviva]
MARLLAYPLSALYLLCFGMVLVVFHPIQWICLNLFGYEAHKRSVSWLNLSIMRCTHILGTRYRITYPESMPEKGPLIIVTNHQSMYDIPPIIWYFRRFHPKFVSKKELGKGIPSVSYNLRHGGSALIDRRDRKQAYAALKHLGEYIENTGRSAVIFPEGTRSRTGHPKPFKTYGLSVLLEHAPSASVVPITINQSWKMFRYGKFPNGLGARITFTVHPPMPASQMDEAGLQRLEETIVAAIETTP